MVQVWPSLLPLLRRRWQLVAEEVEARRQLRTDLPRKQPQFLLHPSQGNAPEEKPTTKKKKNQQQP